MPVADIAVVVRVQEDASADKLRVKRIPPGPVSIPFILLEGYVKHGCDTGQLGTGSSILFHEGPDSFQEPAALLPYGVEDVVAFQDLKRLEGGDVAVTVRKEGRGYEELSRRSHHDLPLPGNSAYGIAVGHAFSEDGQVGSNSIELLRTSHAEPEVGADFVVDQHRAVPVSEFPDAFKESGQRFFHLLMVGMAEGSHNDGSGLAPMLGQKLLELVKIVVAELVHILVKLTRDATFHFNGPVVPAVVAAAYDLDPAGIGPGDTDARCGGI